MFITGPEVIQDRDRRGSRVRRAWRRDDPQLKSGVAHFAADDEESCLEDVRYLMSFLPLNNMEQPPHSVPGDDPTTRDQELDTFVPDDPEQAVRHAKGRGEDRR